MDIDAVVAKLKSMEHVVDVFVPEESDIEKFFEKESEVKTGSGMIFRNDSLEEAKKRTRHLCVVQDKESFDKTPHHLITWETTDGNLMAYDVPPSLRHEVEGRNDLIWLSANFVMEPIPYASDLVCVMHPSPINVVGEEEGVKDVIALYPSPPADKMIRERYHIDDSWDYATRIVSFNML